MLLRRKVNPCLSCVGSCEHEDSLKCSFIEPDVEKIEGCGGDVIYSFKHLLPNGMSPRNTALLLGKEFFQPFGIEVEMPWDFVILIQNGEEETPHAAHLSIVFGVCLVVPAAIISDTAWWDNLASQIGTAIVVARRETEGLRTEQ